MCTDLVVNKKKKKLYNNALRSSFPNMCGILFQKILNAYIVLTFLRIRLNGEHLILLLKSSSPILTSYRYFLFLVLTLTEFCFTVVDN